MVGLGRVELPTLPLSGVRSSQLSYRPGQRAGPSKLDGNVAVMNLQVLLDDRTRLVRIDLGCCETGRPRNVLRKEVIQPQVPLRLPCYDFTPVTSHTMGGYLLYRLSHRLPVQLASMV